MSRISAAVVLLSMLVALAAGTTELRAPDVVVERNLSNQGRITRITLFDNRMAVTSVRQGDLQVFFRQITLPDPEYQVYLDVVTAVAKTAGVEPERRLDGDRIEGVVHISPPGFPARSFMYSPVQVLDLETTRLITALDDLENRVAAVSPSEETLSHWSPEIGDRVVLFSGATATVIDIADDGMLYLEHDAEGLVELVPAKSYHLVIETVIPAEGS